MGKTSLARSLAGALGTPWQRIQFTPDLLPSDVTGVSVFHQDESAFVFHPGPVFANVVLADEINRASPRTQSALLEVMEERQVTVDGRPSSRAEAVPRDRDAEPDRDGRHVPAAGGAARPLPRQVEGRATRTTTPRCGSSSASTRAPESTTCGRSALPSEVERLVRAARTVHVAPAVFDYIVRLVEPHPADAAAPARSRARAARSDCVRTSRVYAALRGRHVRRARGRADCSPSRCSPTAFCCRRRSKRRAGRGRRGRRGDRVRARAARPTGTDDPPRRRPRPRRSRAGRVRLVSTGWPELTALGAAAVALVVLVIWSPVARRGSRWRSIRRRSESCAASRRRCG